MSRPDPAGHKKWADSNSGHPDARCIDHCFAAVQIEIPFDLLIIQRRSTKWSQPEPGCYETECLAEMTCFKKDDSIRAGVSITPHYTRQNSRHHEQSGTVLNPILMTTQLDHTIGNLSGLQQF